MERRTSQRVDLERPCIVRRNYPDLMFCEGMTRNIGRTGALITVAGIANVSFQLGDEITVEIPLEENSVFGQKCMYCRGVVARIDDDGPAVLSLAVEFHNVMFRPATRMPDYTASRMVT